MATPVRRDVKRTSTIANKKTNEFEFETRKTFDEDRPTSGGDQDISISSLRKRKRADTQLELIKRYRERNNDEQRQETQETADEENWLVQVPDKIKFQALVNKEVDKGFLDALDANKLNEENLGKSPVRRNSLNLSRRNSVNLSRRNSDLFKKPLLEMVSRKSSLNLDRRASSSISVKNVEELNQSVDLSGKVDERFLKKKSKFNEDMRKDSEHEIVFQPPPQPHRDADLNISSDIMGDNSDDSSDSSDTEKKSRNTNKTVQEVIHYQGMNPANLPGRHMDSEITMESHEVFDTIESERQNLATETDQLDPWN